MVATRKDRNIRGTCKAGRQAPEGGLPATAMAPYSPPTAVAAVPCRQADRKALRGEMQHAQGQLP